MKKTLLSIGLSLLCVVSFAQLSGTYTINGGQATAGTNFQTFSAAWSALTSQGVNGAVVFNCVEGTYTEQVYYYNNSIAGTSTTNTVTFQADAGNTNDVLWQYSNYPLYLYYGNYNNISFDDIKFATTGSSNVLRLYYVQLTNLTFENCTFTGTNINTTSNYYATIYMYRATTINVTFDSCDILQGSYGMYNYYNNYAFSSSAKLTVSNCNIVDYAFYGIYNYGQYSPYVEYDIKGNYIANEPGASYAYPYGIMCYYAKGGSEISGNNIEINGANGGYGLYVYYPQGNSSASVEVVNNIINHVNTAAPYTQYGILCSYGYYSSLYHNTITTSNNYAYSRALYMYMSSSSYTGNEVMNNIIATPTNTPYGFYGYNYGGAAIDFDNNIWWQGATGEMYMYDGYAGTYSNLSGWQGASGGSNSQNVDPDFTSTTNLTPQSADVNNSGAALGVTTDIYGNTRSTTTPDPGAVEFSVPQNNAGITDLIKPDAPLCADDTSVIAVLKNTGLVTLTSCTIQWSLNGSLQGTMTFNDSLAPSADTTITLATGQSFSTGDSIAAWSSMPNGVQDSAAAYDTSSAVIYTGLVGTYGVPGDYSTLTDAVDDIMLKGICGDVTISITPGTYNEQILMTGEVLGASEDATLTWTSSTGDPDDVKIQYQSTSSADNQVVLLDGTDFVTFEDLSIIQLNTSSYGTGVRLANGAENATFDNCYIRAGLGQINTTYIAAFYADGMNHNLTIVNSHLHKGGYYGMRIYGGGTTSKVENVTIENTTIEDVYSYYPCYMYYIDGLEFNNNTVTSDTNMYAYSYGMYLQYVDNFNITGNYIGADGTYNGNPAGFYYAFYMGNSVGTANPRSQVSNNCINIGAPGQTAYAYYTYMYNSGLFDYHNNTINKAGGYNSYAQYLSGGGLISMKNNSFSNNVGGDGMYVNGGFSISEADYNNFYTVSGSLVNWNGTGYTSIEAYQAGTGNGMHSVSTNPAFADTLTCVTCNDTLSNSGEALTTNMYDIEGNVRSTVSPDIGAHEFVSPSSFTLGGDSTYCSDSILIEAGPAQSITWSVNGSSSTDPTVMLTGGCEPSTHNVLVSITTEYCGSASDNALITLIPSATLDDTLHLCADDAETLDPCGGSTATYAWSTGETTSTITIDGPGSYSVTKMEEGCESSAVIEVTQSQAVDILDVEECSDNLPVTMDATIADGVSYAWDGGTSLNTATNTFNDAGTYNVTATDAMGCTSTDAFSLTVLEEPEAAIGETHSGLTYFYDASASNYVSTGTTYNWDFGSAATPSSSTNMTETVIYPWSNPSSPTAHTVTLEIDNGCGIDLASMEVTPDPLGVEDIEEGTFAVYPNPANDVVNVVTNNADAGSIMIMDMSGRTIIELSIASGSNTHTVNVSDLAAGSYMVKVANDNSATVQSLIIQ